jgi:hypothetical protein
MTIQGNWNPQYILTLQYLSFQSQKKERKMVVVTVPFLPSQTLPLGYIKRVNFSKYL